MALEQALGGEWDPSIVEEVVAIVDGHDSRLHALSRNDELVKDADKLWRYSVTGAGSATVNIRTGDRVVVDGDAGTVSIIS